MNAYTQLLGLNNSNLNDMEIITMINNARLNKESVLKFNQGNRIVIVNIPLVNEHGVTWGEWFN